MNLKPEELVKALRRCANGESEECPFTERGVCGCPEMSADQIERDQKEIEALRAKLPKWISVKERLPIDRLKKYLVAFQDAGGSIVDMARYFPSDGWTCDNWDVPQNLITHWMPLPEAPKEDNHDA
mgnify:CR=1 FL=1